MGFNCGIAGLLNVGKSTLFNALTKAGIAAEKLSFGTKDQHGHRAQGAMTHVLTNWLPS